MISSLIIPASVKFIGKLAFHENPLTSACYEGDDQPSPVDSDPPYPYFGVTIPSVDKDPLFFGITIPLKKCGLKDEKVDNIVGNVNIFSLFCFKLHKRVCYAEEEYGSYEVCEICDALSYSLPPAPSLPISVRDKSEVTPNQASANPAVKQ